MKYLTTLLLTLLALISCSEYESFDECYLKEQQQCSGVEGTDCIKSANKFCSTEFAIEKQLSPKIHASSIKKEEKKNILSDETIEEKIPSSDLNQNAKVLKNWKNNKKDKTYLEKNSYSGITNCKGNLRESFHQCYGAFKYPNQTSYQGMWVNGKMNGTGVYTFDNGTTFKGEFKEDDTVYGTYQYINGDKYSGEFKNYQPEGQGTMIYSDGTKVTGQINNGAFNGQGSIIFIYGNKYIGGIKNSEFHGEGTYSWANGDTYTGQFINGQVVDRNNGTKQGNSRNFNWNAISDFGKCIGEGSCWGDPQHRKRINRPQAEQKMGMKYFLINSSIVNGLTYCRYGGGHVTTKNFGLCPQSIVR